MHVFLLLLEQSPPAPSPAPTPEITVKDVLAPTVALATLVFTVGTFWWNNWRRGHLTVGMPRSFAADSNGKRTRLNLPLSISNTGPRPITVTALRIRALHVKSFLGIRILRASQFVMKDNRFASELDPSKATMQFATSFVVSGRDSEVRIVEFIASGDMQLSGLTYFHVEALASAKMRWRKIGSIACSFETGRDFTRYLVYDNATALPP
jgi:hypothetical protein